MNTTTKCSSGDCEVMLDLDHDDYRYSTQLEGYYCWSCYEAMTESASTVILIEGPAAVRRYRVSAFETVDAEYGEEPYPDDVFGQALSRAWTSTDGWRGSYHTSIDGWTTVIDGWTTGDWGDGTSDRKQPFNRWAERVIDGRNQLPVPVAICIDTTSNVFSTAITVMVETINHQTLIDYIVDDLDTLRWSLR